MRNDEANIIIIIVVFTPLCFLYNIKAVLVFDIDFFNIHSHYMQMSTYVFLLFLDTVVVDVVCSRRCRLHSIAPLLDKLLITDLWVDPRFKLMFISLLALLAYAFTFASSGSQEALHKKTFPKIVWGLFYYRIYTCRSSFVYKG